MRKRFLELLSLALLVAGTISCDSVKRTDEGIEKRWSKEKAKEWYSQHKWLVGCNYIPANAINQLEMWQKDTFDTLTISKEMSLAGSIGFNTLRVYLHSIAWETDPEGFKDRVSIFLSIAERNGIKPMLVFFDDCWNPYPKAGTQPQGTPHTHNSGWVQDPGMDAHKNWDKAFPMLEKYTKDILTTFKDDKRILMWDLYNEPGNAGPIRRGIPRPAPYLNESLPLLKKVFEWAREVNPSQPITSGIWNLDLIDLNTFQIQNSDIITYHNYNDKSDHERMIKFLVMNDRPMVCTEYMSRGSNSTFTDILPILKKYNIGAVSWGFINGKTQTIYPWDSWDVDYTAEPKLWFHDIFKADFTPYDEAEVKLIKELSGKIN